MHEHQSPSKYKFNMWSEEAMMRKSGNEGKQREIKKRINIKEIQEDY